MEGGSGTGTAPLPVLTPGLGEGQVGHALPVLLVRKSRGDGVVRSSSFISLALSTLSPSDPLLEFSPLADSGDPIHSLSRLANQFSGAYVRVVSGGLVVDAP